MREHQLDAADFIQPIFVVHGSRVELEIGSMPGIHHLSVDESLDREVKVNREVRVQRERRDRLLLHLFGHQIHHRGQAHAMLAGTDVPPPQLDEFFSIGEADLRAGEFAELGWTEKQIWG